MIDKNHEKEFISLPDTPKDTTKLQLEMKLVIYGLTGL